MPNQRKKNKKLVGFFADPLEYEAIQKLAKQHAVSVAELLRRIANGTIKLGVWVLGLAAAAALGLTQTGTPSGENAGPQAGAEGTTRSPDLRLGSTRASGPAAIRFATGATAKIGVAG